jgi:hypothetical protein
MIDPAPTRPATVLIDLEARQEDVLRQLDDLNRRIEQALTQSRLQVHVTQAEANPAS